MARAIVGVGLDLLRLGALLYRSSESFRAENLVLRKPPASFRDREMLAPHSGTVQTVTAHYDSDREAVRRQAVAFGLEQVLAVTIACQAAPSAV